MSAKISGTHRNAFLKALAETGNVMLAADQVRVSKDWAYKLRRRDAAFDAEFRAAVAEARERLVAFRDSPRPKLPPVRGHSIEPDGSTEPVGPPRPPPAFAAGLSLSLQGRGVVVQRGNGRRVQVKRARPNQWTEGTAAAFLTALAGTCNVKMAAAAIGTSATSAHARRGLDDGFARAWAEALDIGYVRLQAALIEAATCFFEGEVIPQDNPIRTMSVAEAIQSLNMNKFAVTGEGGRPGRKRR